MTKLSASAVIYELENALETARDYIREQEKEIAELKKSRSYADKIAEAGIKVSPGGLITAKEAAILLGAKSANTVYDMMDQHIIPEVRVKTSRKIHIDDLRQYILNQRRRAI